MIKYDRILTIGLIILEALYFCMIKSLPEKAAKYPLFVLALLIILTIVLGIKSFTTKIEKEKSEIFQGFQEKQFIFIVVLSAIYIFGIEKIGFFISSFVYLIVIMVGLKSNIKWAVISSIVFCLLIYSIFVVFLKVPVPNGILI